MSKYLQYMQCNQMIYFDLKIRNSALSGITLWVFIAVFLKKWLLLYKEYILFIQGYGGYRTGIYIGYHTGYSVVIIKGI